MPITDDRYSKKPLVNFLAMSSIALAGCAGGGGGSASPSEDGQHEPSPSPSLTGNTDPRSDSVLVGVADTGFRLTHESIRTDLVAAINLADPNDTDVITHSHYGTDLVAATNLADPNNTDVTINSRHGTAVASVVAMDPSDTGLILAKVNEDVADYAYSNVMDYSVGFLADKGARVINHSYSGRLEAPSETAAYLGERSLDSLRRIISSNDGLGSVYVVAAGNDGEALRASNPIHQYANLYERMLIVGGSEGDGLHPHSNYPGEDPLWQSRFLTAPWESVVALDDADDSYGLGQGTSFAAPKVAAYAAAIIELWPHLNASEVSQLLLETASKDSPLYQDNTCGANGNINCGTYYLGQGEANVLAALAPQGELIIPASDTVREGGHRIGESVAQLSGAYGDALASSDVLNEVAMIDEMGRDYRIDLADRVLQHTDRDRELRTHMERMAVATDEHRSVLRGELGGFDFAYRHTAHGDITAARLDGHLGRNHWSAYRHAGDEISPVSPLSEADFMPMLSLQGGSKLTRNLDVVSGLTNRFALGDQITLVAGHWTGQADDAHHALISDYRANRSDISLAIDMTDHLTLSAGIGVLQEERGLLGAQGAAALSFGDDNQMNLGRLHLAYRMENRLSAFALYEQGRGDMSGDGLIQSIDGIRTEAMALGLQWHGEHQQVALTWRQPMRIDAADATLSVPVGRTINGRILREERSVSLAPSGRQRDIEIGYAVPYKRSQIQFNLLFATEPGHDRDADTEVSMLINYSLDL